MREILFISATHGNEAFSVDVMQEMQALYDPSKYGYAWIIGNPLAVEQDVRFIDKDLNRSAPGNPNSRYYEGRRAAEITQLSQGYDAVIDIHGSVANCGLVTIVPYPTAESLALAHSIPLRRTVIWFSEASVVSGPLVQHVRCPGIEIECGPQSSPTVADQLRKVIGKIIEANADDGFVESSEQEYFEVYGKELGDPDARISDFQAVTRNGETFYPFMSNQYGNGTLCYKMRKVADPQPIKTTLPYNED